MSDTTQKVSRVIVHDYLGKCPVQCLENIRLTMEQSDWLVLVIGPLCNNYLYQLQVDK